MKNFNNLKHILFGIAASGLMIATPATALAHGGGDRDSRGNQRNTSKRVELAQQSSKAKNKNNQNRGEQDKRRQTCEERQQALNQKATDTQARYTKRLNGMNIMYSGLQTYVSSGNVTVPNYEQLNAAVGADQAAAINAVDAITAPQLNCGTDSEVRSLSDINSRDKSGQNSLNDTIKAARDALNVYRHDLMKLFNTTLDS